MTARTAREIFEELAAEHLTRPGVGTAIDVRPRLPDDDGHNVAFFHDDRLALRLPPDKTAAMLASGEATTPLMGKRAMRNWVAVPLSGGPAGTDRWRALLGEAAATATTD